MEPIAEKGVSAAPASKHGVKVCDRCHAQLEDDVEECPDCGSPVIGLQVIENLGEPVQAELAKANLLRMRHQYAESEEQCLSILKHFPHNFEAHALMGDIYSEQAQFEQAAQWYELALELDPTNFLVRQRLQVSRDRLTQDETETTAEQLGLPQNNGVRVVIYSALALVVILLCGFIAYSVGQRNAKPGASQVIREGVAADSSTVQAPPTIPEAREAPGQEKVAQVGASALAKEDADLLQSLTQTNFGHRILLANLDPRSKQLIIGFRLESGENERRMAAEIARDALAAVPESPNVTIKALRDGHYVYIADVPRGRMADTQAPAWQQSSNASDAWVNYVLTNEWFAVSSTPPDQPAPDAGGTP
jgi:tetratricopeptide (TPR) repeat protein